MLTKEAIEDKESLARIMSEMHDEYEKENVPMDDEKGRYSILVMTASNNRINNMYDDFMNHWQCAGFFRRCEYAFNIKFEKRLLVWLCAMTADFGIGGMMLIAYYVRYRAHVLEEKFVSFKNDLEAHGELTLEMVCEKIFHFGVFEKETVHRFWEEQKVQARPDNLIDHPKAALSFNPSVKLDPITPAILEV